jgi:hypothetical protein
LETELRDAEILRNDTQSLFEKTTAEMNVKVDLFKGRYEVGSDNPDLIKGMQQLAE